MKRLFTLAIIAMIASLTFAQAPVQKMKASEKKIEKVATTAQMKKGMEAKAAFQAKAQAAQETSTSVLRKAVKQPTAAMAKQMTAPKMIPNSQVSRVVKPTPGLKTRHGILAPEKVMHKFASTNSTSTQQGPHKAEGVIDIQCELVAAQYYGAPDYDWFLVFNSTDGTLQFRFDIANQPADALPLNQVFTEADMVLDYSWAQNGLTNSYIFYNSVSFIATENANGIVEYDATVVGDDGATYHVFTGDATGNTDVTSEETWAFTAAESSYADLTEDMGILQLIGMGEDGRFAMIALSTTTFAGTYNFSNVYGNGSYTAIFLDENDAMGVKCTDLNATVTEEGATVDYYGENGILYHISFVFVEGGDEPGTDPTDATITKDEHGIITSVAGGVKKSYARSTDAMAYYYASGTQMTNQSGYVTVVEDGDKVYIKDPITRYTQGSWVEGTKNGNMIVIPSHQPLAWSDQYSATISLRYGVVTAAGTIAAADDYAENFVFTVDGDVWTLENTAAWDGSADAYYMGAYWDDDDSSTGYGDAETVLTYDPDYVAPSTDLVELPAGATVENWLMSAGKVSSTGTTPIMNQPVNVSFVGNDVYLGGLFTDFPNSWVKGTKSGSTVTFDNLQYLGKYSTYDIYFAGTDGEGLTNATATLAADGQTITFNDDILANAATDRIYYLSWLENVVIGSTPAEEPVITDLTATLPYTNGFDTDTEIDEAAIYDANGDGKTWTITNDTNTGSNAARYAYNSSSAANDYIVFPGLALEAGKSYKVAVDARANGSYFPEKVEVVAGTVAKASELNTVVVPEATLQSADYETLASDFTPAESGTYYFAIHATSDADMFYLFADNFQVKENNPNTPNAATDFTAVAGAEGALEATLTFTLPSTTVGGDALEMVEYAISRDGVEIIQGVAAAGSTKTKKDSDPVNGVNNYSLVVKANDLVSDAVKASVYVGEDLPTEVENLTAYDHNTAVALEWTAPTEGVNGGYVNPETLSYNVYPIEMIDFFGMQYPAIDFENPYATGVSETNYDVEFDTNEGDQAFTYFGVTAENAGGETNGAMTAILTGAPYDIPVHEGLTGQALHYWWGTACDDDNYNLDGGLYFSTVESSDDDNVCFQFVAKTEGWIDMESGKIALNNAENPVLAFDFKADAACTLNVKVITPEGEEIVGLMPVENTEWAPATIDLSFYADQPWVRFVLTGEFEDANNLYVDNVNVMNAVPTDLEVKVSAPKTLVAGKSAIVKATVTNLGLEEAANYDVKFFINDVEAAAPLFEVEPLAFFQSTNIEFELATSVFDQLGDVTVKAVVTIADDANEANNADETVIEVVAPSATPVSSVTAEQTSEGVVVNWTIASDAAQEVTEDFDSYADDTVFADGESCGPWLAADLSQGSTYSWNSGAWNHMGEAYAFGIINMVNEGLDANFPTPSGEQAALFMSEVNEATQSGQASDKYMISPELPGVAQTISFQARPITAQYGAETFEILASSTDQAPSSFTKVASLSTDTEDWLEFSANLPEGTRYFAIHYTSNDIFGLFIDDLKYTVGGGTPTGFNVYVDENLVATTDGNTNTYTYGEELSEGAHEFSVTAVYGNSESAPVTAIIDIKTGISEISADADVEIYTVDGIRMNNVKNLKSGVYVVNGQKVVIK